MLKKQDEGKLTRGYPLGTTGVQKRRRGTSMSWSYEQQHLHAFLQPQLPGQKHVYLRIDNTTAVEYITKRGYTLPCSHSSSPGTMRSGLGCWSFPDSTAHSRHSEYSNRYSFQADRDQNRMLLRQEKNSNPSVRSFTNQKWISLHPA